MDEWTKAPFCVMINRNKCDNYSVDRICEVTEQLILCQEKVQIKNDFFPSCQHT